MSEVKPDEIPTALSRLFRADSQLGAGEILDVRPILNGWETEVYSFMRVRFQNGNRAEEPLILRLYHGGSAGRKMVHEREVMERLRKEGYPVPSLLAGSPEPEPFGKPYLVMERIMGPTLSAAMKRGTPNEFRELLSLFCGLFLRLHRMDWRKLTPEPVRYEGGSSDYLRDELDKAVVFGEETGLNMEAGFCSVLRWLNERLDSVPSAPLAFIHYDFHPENVLLREDGTPSVIDWGSGQAGDFRSDLAWTLLLMGTHGSPQLRADVRSEYERLRGETIAGMEFFDVWASAQRLYDIYLSLKGRPEHTGIRPGAVDLIKGQMAVVERVYEFFCLRSGLKLPEIEKLFA